MCIVLNNIKNVSDIKISSFNVAYVRNGELPSECDLVVFSARMTNTSTHNCIALPIYNPGNDYHNIIPLNMQSNSDWFDNITRVCDKWTNVNDTVSGHYNVTDYKMLVLRNKHDFDNFDNKIFKIVPDARSTINAHSDDYSFILCLFENIGPITVGPFAYVHKLSTSMHLNKTMILPTINGYTTDQIPEFTYSDTYGYNYNTISDQSVMEFKEWWKYNCQIYTSHIKCFTPNAKNHYETEVLDNLLKRISFDYTSKSIRIFVPSKCMISCGKIDMTDVYTNRNLLCKISKADFIKDLIPDNA